MYLALAVTPLTPTLSLAVKRQKVHLAGRSVSRASGCSPYGLGQGSPSTGQGVITPEDPSHGPALQQDQRLQKDGAPVSCSETGGGITPGFAPSGSLLCTSALRTGQPGADLASPTPCGSGPPFSTTTSSNVALEPLSNTPTAPATGPVVPPPCPRPPPSSLSSPAGSMPLLQPTGGGAAPPSLQPTGGGAALPSSLQPTEGGAAPPSLLQPIEGGAAPPSLQPTEGGVAPSSLLPSSGGGTACPLLLRSPVPLPSSDGKAVPAPWLPVAAAVLEQAHAGPDVAPQAGTATIPRVTSRDRVQAEAGPSRVYASSCRGGAAGAETGLMAFSSPSTTRRPDEVSVGRYE